MDHDTINHLLQFYFMLNAQQLFLAICFIIMVYVTIILMVLFLWKLKTLLQYFHFYLIILNHDTILLVYLFLIMLISLQLFSHLYYILQVCDQLIMVFIHNKLYQKLSFYHSNDIILVYVNHTNIILQIRYIHFLQLFLESIIQVVQYFSLSICLQQCRHLYLSNQDHYLIIME